MVQDINQIKQWVGQLVGAVTRTNLPLEQHQAAMKIGEEIIKACGGTLDATVVEASPEDNTE